MRENIHTRQISVAGLKSILLLAERFGGNAHQIARDAELEPSYLSLPDATIPLAQFIRLLNLISEQSNTPDIGLYLGRISHLEKMHLLMYLASASRSLRDWLNMIPSVASLFGDAGEVKIKREGEQLFALQWHPAYEPRGRCHLTDSIISTSVLQMTSFCLIPVCPVRADLSYAPPSDQTMLRSVVGQEIRFNQPISALYFERKVLDYPLAKVSTRFYDQAAEEFLSLQSPEAKSADEFSLTIQAIIRRQLPTAECSIDSVAKDLNVSQRTLQRRLKERDTNFQQLLKGIKSSLAKKYLGDRSLSIIEIGFLLGYTDQSTFSAAFKSWNGLSPSEFRHQMA